MIIFFLLGMHMASFYTVVGMRLPIEEDIVKKPSHCDNCGHQLNFLDMIPVLSYIVNITNEYIYGNSNRTAFFICIL